MADDDAPWRLDDRWLPPPEVTRALFDEWRAARPGTANPERMTNPVWTWLARESEIPAFMAAWHFTGVDDSEHPGWTNRRYGQSTTELPDGRDVAIAGAHESGLDRHGYVYNDVIITAGDGSIEIYGYPRAVFPPTAFHSATLIDDQLYLIGNLGHGEPSHAHAQVLRLDLRTLAVEQLVSLGTSPGRIGHHTASSSGDGAWITVTGGRCALPGWRQRDNADDYVLDLSTLEWARTTDRQWTQYAIECEGGVARRHDIAMLAHLLERGDGERWQRQAASYRARLGYEPDLAAWRTRFQPPLAHQALPRANDDDDDDAWRTHRIAIDGIIVRYVDRPRSIEVVIEGSLPAATVALVIEDLRAKLARAARGPCVTRRLDTDADR